ncbi:peptide-binding protein [Syntrophotalea acetylenivorans]|uniref:Peptide-binding protein n=1 Tax=Syntrophotalea acetylenivorans TaxID=1842532 RepID=A0A1L3GMJ1_9BACT|nr:peptide-binding protein [Syntrophotalea acetylenivorans]
MTFISDRFGLVWIFLGLCCLYLICGCDRMDENLAGQAEAGPPAAGDTLIIGSGADAVTLLPVLASDGTSSDINGLVYNGLVRYDKDLNIEADLAERWEISPDNLTITFHLRQGVRWHDGAPFTAEDVLYTYQLLIDPKTPTAYAERYRQVASAQVLDAHTFRVRYHKPLATALISWAFSVHPRHLLEGTEITKSPLASHPVGTGPYRFVAWKRGEKIVLEANPDYYEGPPYIHRVLYRVIPDASTMFLEMQSGGLDYMGLTPLQYAMQTDTPAFRRRFRKYRYPAFAYTYLGYNLRRPIFQDKRTRQALSFAIDKQEIIDGVLLGLGQVASGPYKPGSWVHNPEVAPYRYDPNRARTLLAEAGWQDSDGDGVLDRNGQSLSFTIVTNQGNDQRVKAGEIIQRRLSEVGVKVKLQVVEWAAFLKEFINPGNFDATILGWSGGIDPDVYNVWHSSKTGPGELNFIAFKNAEVDHLLEAGRRTYDQDERKLVYDRFQEILAEEQPYTFLYVPESLPVVAARFRGIEPAPAGIMHNFIQWYVPAEEHKYSR